MYRSPLFLLCRDDYSPIGAVCKESGRYIGLDTLGRVIFNRKDFYGMQSAVKRIGARLVSSAWYGIQP